MRPRLRELNQMRFPVNLSFFTGFEPENVKIQSGRIKWDVPFVSYRGLNRFMRYRFCPNHRLYRTDGSTPTFELLDVGNADQIGKPMMRFGFFQGDLDLLAYQGHCYET